MDDTICLDFKTTVYESQKFTHAEIFEHFSDEEIKKEYYKRLLGSQSVIEEKVVCIQIKQEFSTHQVKEIWDCIEESYHKDIFERI